MTGPRIAEPLQSHGQRIDEVIDEAVTQATLRGSRLLTLREWIGPAQWRLFCIDHPDARGWFDEHGEPR